MLALFLLSIFFSVYTFLIFPVVLHIRASGKTIPKRAALDEYPTVSVIMAVHNEQQYLQAKLECIATQDYPVGKLQIIVASDGSTDDTVNILSNARSAIPNLEYTHYEPPAGKPSALNRAISLATGEILVFMDARQLVSNNAVKVLVERLQQPGIGAVSGELILANSDGMESENVGLYWRYEKWIRTNESKLFSTTGATGALYAIRASAYAPHDADVLLDDFNTPVSILASGQRTVLEPDARVFDKAEQNVSGEYKRKVRTLAGNFQSFKRFPWLFSPRKNPVFLQFISHKVFRLLVPYAMIVAFLSSMLGQGVFLQTMFVAQLLFYGLGIANMAGLKMFNNKALNFISVFIQLNAAAVVGAYRFITGSANVRWRTQ